MKLRSDSKGLTKFNPFKPSPFSKTSSECIGNVLRMIVSRTELASLVAFRFHSTAPPLRKPHSETENLALHSSNDKNFGIAHTSPLKGHTPCGSESMFD